jgi:hypothetical protein
MIDLPTKTFGKAAKAFVKQNLPTLSTVRRVDNSFVLRDSKGKMLGHVNEGGIHNPKAVLVLSIN